MLDASYYASLGLADVLDKVLAGQRLSAEDGMALFACPDITAVGALAHHARCRMHGDKTSYVVNRQINYTNVCVNGCVFCAFRRDREEDQGAFCLSTEEVLERLRAADATPLHLDELHIVGGCHPTRPFQWFLDTLRAARELNPDLLIKAFTPVEIAHFAKMEGCSTLEVLQRLKEAGLVMMPGGGAEIFDEEIRARICPDKGSTAEWLAVHEAAHRLGIKTNATILYGHIEGVEHRIDHLDRLRALQDRTGGFNAFIPLKYRNYGNAMSEVGEVSVIEDLRMLAMSRIYLDNIPHVKAYWVMYGKATTELALAFGADDIDGTIDDTTKIYSMAGADDRRPRMTADEMRTIVRHAGLRAVERDTLYNEL
mgnify:CR=1 FL=1